MSWCINRSPFGPDENPLDHMVELLSAEAIKDGAPLTERDREILANAEPMPEILRQRAKELIPRIFEKEPIDDSERDPKCFSCSLECSLAWADNTEYPNILALAEEVAHDIARAAGPPYGWKRAKDKLQLVGCGLIVVLLMFAVVVVAGSVLHWT